MPFPTELTLKRRALKAAAHNIRTALFHATNADLSPAILEKLQALNLEISGEVDAQLEAMPLEDI